MTPDPAKDPIAFVESIRREAGGNHPDQIWRAVLSASQTCSCSPENWRAMWDEVQKGRGVPTGSPAPMWFPDRDALENSQLARWMRERGDRDFGVFQAWSLSHRDQFWSAAASRLGIVFDQPATTTLIDKSRGTSPQWFPGARLNIARSCFLAPDDSFAIVSRRPGDILRHRTVGELRAEVNQIVGAIRAAGFQPGDALGVVLPLTPVTVALYLGIIAAGCRAVSIADSFAPPEIGSRLRIANARAVFTCDVQVRGGKTLPLGQRVQQATDLPAIALADVDGQLAIDLRPGDRSWDEFLAAGKPDTAWHSAEPSEIVNVLFSSGTTGDPKAIPWTHLTPLKCAVDGLVHQDIRPGHVCCWPTSLGWMMGPWLIFATLINRGTVALYEDAPMGEGFGQFVQDAGVNMLGVVPTIVRAWRESRAMEGFDWSKIHCFSSTGESSRADDMHYLSSLAGMRPVIEYCGGTEIGGGYISSTLLQPNVPAAFSTPAAGLDFVILDEAGQPTEEGELFIIPPCIGLSTTLLNRDHFATYYADTPPCPGFVAEGRKPSGYFSLSLLAEGRKPPGSSSSSGIVAEGRKPFGDRATTAQTGLQRPHADATGTDKEEPGAGATPLRKAEEPGAGATPLRKAEEPGAGATPLRKAEEASSPLPILRRHGDHFRRMPGNYFCAGGRVDDTMNLGGIKTSSAELERVLNQVPGVRETAAVAWSESGGPDELHVFYVPSGTTADEATNSREPEALADSRVDEITVESAFSASASGSRFVSPGSGGEGSASLIAAMNARLKSDLNPLFKVRAIHAVDHLPRTASNKVMRRLLRDRLGTPS
jgi:acetyl-CoA synthetase